MLKSLLATLLLGVSIFVWAADAPPASDDPVLEKRVMAISEELRCLVCQNQTIADSHAELAIDLRNQVREMLKKGLSEKEIRTYMVERYGDFVLYRPPVKASTWVLWLGPFLLLVVGLAFLLFKFRQRAKQTLAKGVDPLSGREHQRVHELLGTDTESREKA